MKFSCIALAIFTSMLIGQTMSQIVQRNLGTEVRNGRTVEIRKENLSFNVRPGQMCKVQVINNEPVHQSLGLVTPTIFDCNYLAGLVKYQHNGSPFADEDTILMRAHIFLKNQTVEETFSFRVSIINSRCDVIRVNQVPLVVPNLQKRSNPVTRDVVDFDYDSHFDTVCYVKIPSDGFPRFGRLIVPRNSSEISNVEYLAVDNLKETCENFILKKIKYEHLYPPTPDIDYIPLHVTVSDRRSGSLLIDERHWLPIRINGAFPNQPPKSSFSNMYILEVDQFVLTNILPMTVSAIDGETRNEDLIFNITRPPEQGFITHLQDQSKPIQSFLQQDLQDLQIAYRPPNVSFEGRQTFEAEFVVIDEYFAQSDPIRVLFSVRVAYTNAPRISWNKGLTMLEGQSRVIDIQSIQVVDKDNLHQVRFTLAGGLRHGRLYVNGKPGFSFGWRDVVDGLVSYQHDDTDTRNDFIVFRVTDRLHSVRFKLPITIFPKDDAPPFLINNIVFELQEGQMILIHRFMLEASDADSAADYIVFNITTPPRAGEIQKKRKWERSGWQINSFQQSDLYKGLIYYKHLGFEKFNDCFEFTLKDSNQPTPNISPVHRVEIKITPVDDLYPEPGPGNSLILTVNETDVIPITSHQLHFLDIEQDDSDVTYTVINDLYRVDGLDEDAGKLIFTDDMVMLMKDPTVPTLRTFTQTAINHTKVAYMPPISDIGSHPVDVEFVFSVADDAGKEITGQIFTITILPVDNQAPTISMKDLFLNEGGTEFITADLIQLRDEDTEASGLKIILTRNPVTGTLRKDNIVINKGESFTFKDVKHFRITYVHNGSEVLTDSFQLTATDGNQNSSAIMRIQMEPVDDELPIISVSNVSLHVPEGGSSRITRSILSATDVDTNDDVLIFEVLTLPRLGSLTIDGRNVVSFLQRDINNGYLFYTHNGREIGKKPLHDFATVMVSDRHDQGISGDENLINTNDIYFTILPVNSRPPVVALGHRVFHCDEGDSKVISTNYIMADDEDTPIDKLVYLIDSPPSYGYIEDVAPKPGFESRSGVRTDSFTHEQLLSGYIRYMQSEHEGLEPTSDRFSVSVTDGQFKSVPVPFLVSISPTNDEEPIISVENITCNEGFMKILSLNVEDLDIPKDEIMITITQPPDHGMIMNEMEMLSRIRRSTHGRQKSSTIRHVMHHVDPIDEFSLQDLKKNLVIPAYVHGGSEEGKDEFELKFSDGKHISKRRLSIKVMPVNDERPSLIINNGITIRFGESKVISGIALHASDDDTASDKLIYELLSVPKRGKLQLRTDHSDWVDLELGDFFTEYHVEMNRLRYVHTSVLGSKGKDTFRFSVSDGEFTTPRQNFQVSIENTKKNFINVITHPLHVLEGEKVFLSTEILTASDASMQPQEITFDIIREPVYGRIEYVAFPNVPIEMFTQLDLLARSVVYVHTSKADSPIDTFRIMANNGLRTREADLSVLITSIDSELPTLIVNRNNSDSSPTPSISLFRDASVVISSATLQITDPDSPKENLHLLLNTLPLHGVLTLNGVTISKVDHPISEVDLEGSNFFYQHSGNEAGIDHFSFIVTDGVNNGYIYQGALKREPTKFYLKIEELDEDPPLIQINIETRSIQRFGQSKFYRIPLDHHSLEAWDEGTNDLDDISFTLARPPLYGILTLYISLDKILPTSDIQKCGMSQGNDHRNPIHRFSQSDLNVRNIFYVIASRLNVTNDSFLFDVEDSWGNVLVGQRFSMSWSRVEIRQKSIKVCENVGTVPVEVKRFGNLDTSSFIGLILRKGSAKPGIDFVPGTARQIQFDPGTSTGEWKFRVVNDGLDERREKFRFQLHSPVNCVLTPKKDVCVVTILDKTHKSCRPFSSPVSIQKKLKKNRRKKTKLLNDSPTTGRKVVQKLYGKLPPGTTVSPQSFFRNRTIRVWKYHAISSVTINEEDGERSLSSFQENNAFNYPSTNTSQSNRDQLNDDPKVAGQEIDAFTSHLNVENTNRSVMITVRGKTHKQHRPQPSEVPRSVLEQCILARRGALYYDAIGNILYQCNGASWIPWNKAKKTSMQADTISSATTCSHGWKSYKNRCYFFGESGLNWNSAQRRCREKHSSNLVTINEKNLIKFLWKFVNRSKFWIGLNKKVDPNRWEWASGTSNSFTNWKRGSPIDGTDKRCVFVGSKRKWIPFSCSRRTEDVKFVCEKSL